ncbi:MAG TPA: hypothetical protein VH309_08765 [Elusimicrobiota bacterium]|nr:hypothetical protein [Elusimicrobiota bacterium]
MAPLAAAGLGGLAGFLGAGAAHVLTVLLSRHGGGEWLHGPFGPPFFAAALYTGIFYGAIGAAAGRRAAAAAGFFGGFLGLLIPLYVLTRYGGWTPAQWSHVMLAAYVLVLWGTIAGIGAASTRAKPWRGAAAAVLGSLAGYALLAACLKLFHGLSGASSNPLALRPPLVNLLDGLLSGAGLCLALSVEGRHSRRIS